MSVIIPFLSAVGPESQEIGVDLSDLKYLAEDVPESDLIYHTNDITQKGDQIQIDIPVRKKLVIVSLSVVPASKTDSNSYCYAHIKYGGNIVDTVYYDHTLDNTSKVKEATKGLSLVGDGTRQMTIEATDIGGTNGKVILLGFYKDTKIKKSQPVQNLRAVPKTKTSVDIIWNPPVDNGGNPIRRYSIQQSSSKNFASATTLTSTFTSTAESDITYTVSSLTENSTYYFRVQPDNTPSSGSVTGTGVSTHTHTVGVTVSSDPPDTVSNLTATQSSPSQITLSWLTPNSGSNTIRGYYIQQQIGEHEHWTDFRTNTRSQSTTINITAVPNQLYRYRIKAINRDSRTSLDWSDTAEITLTIGAPSNVELSVNSASTKLTIDWDKPKNSELGHYEIEGYKIQRSVDGSLFTDLIENTRSTKTEYKDDTIQGSRTYYYRVIALSDHFESLPTDIASLYVPARVPSRPRLHAKTKSESEIDLNWELPLDDDGASISSLEIQRSQSRSFTANASTLIRSGNNVSGRGPIKVVFTATGDSFNSTRVWTNKDGVSGANTFLNKDSPLTITLTDPAVYKFILTATQDAYTVTITVNGESFYSRTTADTSQITTPTITVTSDTNDENSMTAATTITRNSRNTLSHTVSSGDAITIGNMSVSLNITHPFRGDLRIILTAPDNTEITLKEADPHDHIENYSETFSGHVFNDYIGESSRGRWRIVVQDVGTSSDTSTRSITSWSINFYAGALITTTSLTDILNPKYTSKSLIPNIKYYYRIRAINRVGNGAWSNIVNAVTYNTLFPTSTRNETVTADKTLTFEQYNNLTINTGVTAKVKPNSVLIISGTLTINGTGKIVIDSDGCAGGTKGISHPGLGGAAHAFFIRGEDAWWTNTAPNSKHDHNNPGQLGTKTSPTLKNTCANLEQLESDFYTDDPELFIPKIKTQGGGYGSAGTEAADSGAGGRSSSASFVIRKSNSVRTTGRRTTENGVAGGNGGQGAHGVDGARGGSKILIIVNTIASNPTIECKGADGNNGNKGTGTAGTTPTQHTLNTRQGNTQGSYGYYYYYYLSNATAGASASTSGTHGSEGGQGGVVCIYYKSLGTGITEDSIKSIINVDGGQGGLHGAPSTSTDTHLTTRANNGEAGFIFIRKV